MIRPEPKPYLLNIVPYIAGESKVPGVDNPAKLSSNESPLGPSPAAVAAYEDAAKRLQRYPHGGATELREALGAGRGIDPDCIVCSNGSEQMIAMIARAYAGPGDEVMYTEYSFVSYRIAAMACGATPVPVAENNYTTDVAALLAAVTDRTKVMFLANPNNPTGTWITREELHRLRDGLPDHVLLVVDSAYGEYVDLKDYSDGSELVARGNTIAIHTFSKIYGLAALRVGWAQCHPDMAPVLNRIRGVFNVSHPGQMAAIAALQDEAHTEKAKAHNAKWLPKITHELEAMGLTVSPSIGNFVLMHFADAAICKAADNTLRQNGIILRPVANYGLPACLRASVGLDDENEKMLGILRDFLA